MTILLWRHFHSWFVIFSIFITTTIRNTSHCFFIKIGLILWTVWIAACNKNESYVDTRPFPSRSLFSDYICFPRIIPYGKWNFRLCYCYCFDCTLSFGIFCPHLHSKQVHDPLGSRILIRKPLLIISNTSLSYTK